MCGPLAAYNPHMMRSSRCLGTSVVAGVLLVSAACGKKAAPPPTAAAGAVADAGPGPATADKKVVQPRPLTKADSKPGPAANGRNPLLELGAAVGKPVAGARGRFVLRYQGPDSETRAMVRQAGVFEKIMPQLNQSLRLPRDIGVSFADCDEPNAFYDADAVAITVCNEYVDYYGELFSEFPADDARDAILGSLVSTFLHEAGHALIHQLELPTVGREEDVADQLSTVILIASGDEGNAMAIDGAYAFIAEDEADGEETPYWDEHALDQQRFYNTVCLIYGSDPDGWDELVGDDDLPDERADQCPDEYQQISTAWNRLLAPYLTVPTVRMTLAKDR